MPTINVIVSVLLHNIILTLITPLYTAIKIYKFAKFDTVKLIVGIDSVLISQIHTV